MERDRRFYIRLTKEEYELLEKLAEEDEETHSRNKKKNMSAFIRKQIFTGSSLEQGLTEKLKDVEYQVRKIGVNINQVAAKANSSYVSGKDIEVLLAALDSVDIQFLEMTRKLEESYGGY